MKTSTAIALRSHVVMLLVAIGFACVPFILASVLFDFRTVGKFALRQQVVILAVALLMLTALRWRALRAFESARDVNLIELSERTQYRASIASNCPRAWLVQLHVELRGGSLSGFKVLSDGQPLPIARTTGRDDAPAS